MKITTWGTKKTRDHNYGVCYNLSPETEEEQKILNELKGHIEDTKHVKVSRKSFYFSPRDSDFCLQLEFK